MQLSAADITAATTGVAGYGVTKTLGDGMDAKIALVLNAQTVLRVYVKPKDGAAVITPYAADEVIGSDTYYVYETAPIGPLHLGSDQTVTVETSDGTATVTASAMSYVKAMLEWASATDAQKLAMMAYYNYDQAALAYKSN